MDGFHFVASTGAAQEAAPFEGELIGRHNPTVAGVAALETIPTARCESVAQIVPASPCCCFGDSEGASSSQLVFMSESPSSSIFMSGKSSLWRGVHEPCPLKLEGEENASGVREGAEVSADAK